MHNVVKIYRLLLRRYGTQGWWPVIDTEAGRCRYHTGAPSNEREAFEIALGAILTQNVSWKNAEKALLNIAERMEINPGNMVKQAHDELADMIRPSGYYNQKALKIKAFLEWFGEYRFSFSYLRQVHASDDLLRADLLSVKGIGPETADSILLYAMGIRNFVVDAYTKRVLERMDMIPARAEYHEVQNIFYRNFNSGVKEYRDYHALFVRHCKEHCTKQPRCEGCCLTGICCFTSRAVGQ